MKKTIIIALMTVCSMSMQAQFHGGSGTESDPYLVSDGYDLADMANYRTSHFKQVADIDLTEWISDNSSSAGWMPVGTKDAPFEGSFDGGNHTISGLKINRPSSDYVGLFGYTAKGYSIQNIRIESPNVNGGNYTGVVVGHSESKISNIQAVAAIVKGIAYVGGICGSSIYLINECNAEITSLTASGNYVGGVVGYGSVESSQVTALIISGNTNVGGITGLTGSSTKKCIAITNHLEGTYNVGGIVGQNGYNVDQCYAFANIKSEYYAGGICGYGYLRQSKYYSGPYSSDFSYPDAKQCQITNCSFDGTVNAKMAGGVIGTNFAGSSTELLGSSYNYTKFRTEGLLTRTCLVRNADIIGEEAAGGIEAFQRNPSATYNVENCISLANKVGCMTTDSAARIANTAYGKNNKAYNQTELIQSNKKVLNITDDAMNGIAYGEKTLMRSSSYTGLGWDFNTIWTIREGESYPFFQAQTDYPVITEVTSGNKSSIKGTSQSSGKVTVMKDGAFITAPILDNAWEVNLGAVKKGDVLYIFCQTENKMPSVVVRYVISGSTVDPGVDKKLGDANGDGVVDTADVTAIINYILGKPSASFNKDNADVTGDGDILIDDAVQTVQLIMNAQ